METAGKKNSPIFPRKDLTSDTSVAKIWGFPPATCPKKCVQFASICLTTSIFHQSLPLSLISRNESLIDCSVLEIGGLVGLSHHVRYFRWIKKNQPIFLSTWVPSPHHGFNWSSMTTGPRIFSWGRSVIFMWSSAPTWHQSRSEKDIWTFATFWRGKS